MGSIFLEAGSHLPRVYSLGLNDIVQDSQKPFADLVVVIQLTINHYVSIVRLVHYLKFQPESPALTC